MPGQRPWVVDGGGAPGHGSRAPMRKLVPLGRMGDEGAMVVLTPVVARRTLEICSRDVPRDPPRDPCWVGLAVERALVGSWMVCTP